MRRSTILLVEDDRFVAQAYEFFLTRAGHKVVVATDGVEAMAKIREHHPDLILLDLVMPELNGFEILEVWQGRGITDRIPVIVISNLSQEATVAECLSLGATDYVIKSNHPMKEVLKKIEHQLRIHAS